MTQALQFKNPPPVKFGRESDEHDELVTALKSRPSEWALAFEDKNSSIASVINAGKIAAFAPAGSFEATCRGVNRKGQAKEIYVRYVGTPTTANNTEETS